MRVYRKILSIDYGRRHIGLALANSLIPEPLPPLKIDSLEDAVIKISAIVEVTEPEIIIVGMPEGPLAAEVYNLMRALVEETNRKIVSHPETLTTQEALSKLREKSASQNKLKSEHSFSACLILEDYLESTTVSYSSNK